MTMLGEYIRYCYFESFDVYNPNNLEKYCRLLTRFERCNHAPIVKHCRTMIKDLLNLAIKSPYSTKSVELALCFASCHDESICELSEELMQYSIGSHVRGVSF